MKKMLVGMLCNTILFTGLAGGINANASEMDDQSEKSIEFVEHPNDVKQTRGVVNGIVYTLMMKTGKTKPPVRIGAKLLVYTLRDNGCYYGYYR